MIKTTRKTGPFDLSPVVLGCMNLNHAYGQGPSDEYSGKLLNYALDLGVTMLDTAAIYGLNRNEELLARHVGHRRDEYLLASKCVMDVFDGERGINGSPEAITKTLDAALKRLNTDHIDLYYLHRLDKRVPIEESVGALSRAVEAGKISYVGLSEMSATTIRKGHSEHPIAAVQSEYSPCVLNPEIAVLDLCEELNIGFLGFSPTGRGLLAGSVQDDNYEQGDIRANMQRFIEPQLSHNLKIVSQFNELAASIEITPAQLAIAWVIAQRPCIVALPGTRSIEHLEEDLGAANIILTQEILDDVRRIFAPGAIKGGRYPAAMQLLSDTETFPDEELPAS